MPDHEAIEADPDQPMTRAVTAPHGTVLWTWLEQGEARLLGQEEAGRGPGSPPLPLTERSWLEPVAPGRISAVLTPTALARGMLWPALDAFHRDALGLQRRRCEGLLAVRLDRAAARQAAERQGFGGAIRRIAAVLRPPTEAGLRASPDPGIAAALLVAAAEGIAFDPPRPGVPLPEALRRAGLRSREVMLAGAWWREGPGPLIGQLASGAPVALLPDGPGRMQLHDPATGRRRPLDAKAAADLVPLATRLYRRLPDRVLGPRDLLAFCAHGLGPDLGRLALMGALGGLVALLTPLAISHLFGKVLPRGDEAGVLAVVAGRVLAALGAAVFEAVRGIALLRAQGAADGSLQGAIWDRVLRMPPGFFRSNSVGDLTDRANSIIPNLADRDRSARFGKTPCPTIRGPSQ